MYISKTKEVEMNRSYNYIKRLVDRNGIITSNKGPIRCQDGKQEANQLDGKQRHAGFDYYEYNMPMFGTPGWVRS